MNERTVQIAVDFTKLCSAGDLRGAADAFYAPDIVSYEAFPGELAVARGREAVERKVAWWAQHNQTHGVQVQGPFVNGDQFAVRFALDVTPSGGARMTMEEVALYTVRDGKIVEERFFAGVAAGR